MRTHKTATRTAALATSVVLALGLAACGGSDDDQGAEAATTEQSAPAEETPAEEEAPAEGTDVAGDDVCGASQVLTEASSTMSAIDPSEPEAAVAQLEELTGTLEAVDNPPAEIADDWNTLATSFRAVTDGLGEVVENPTDPESMTKVSDAMALMNGTEFSEAAQAVGTYTGVNC
ncbi:hypothetical protein LEP48_02230 [Isoptericola sp. NEAU-Y5]|uniref:Lipoprotein n=1 Tax=Isoptericola luteus TaxID=2879484 RepID=A0ABS7ZAS9_9MICO|nr:hypothetical protein [Isoptericola sp. NEAU-Y5]MCA5892166.1 hypothetical protein [Isoptericola sp. NEAU-Y5]